MTTGIFRVFQRQLFSAILRRTISTYYLLHILNKCMQSLAANSSPAALFSGLPQGLASLVVVMRCMQPRELSFDVTIAKVTSNFRLLPI